MPASFSSTPLHASDCLKRRLKASSTRAESGVPSLAAASSASARREASMVTHFVFFTGGEGGLGDKPYVGPGRCAADAGLSALGGVLQVRRFILCRDVRDIVNSAFYIAPLSAEYCGRAVLHCGVAEQLLVSLHGARRGGHEAQCGEDELVAVCLLVAVEGLRPHP